MQRYFWQPILGWFSGMILCIVLTSIALKLGWKNPYEVLLWGYAMVGSISAFVWTQLSIRKKEDRKELEEKLALKADAKDIVRVECLFNEMKDTIKVIKHEQGEIGITIQKIYDHLLTRVEQK